MKNGDFPYKNVYCNVSLSWENIGKSSGKRLQFAIENGP